MDLQKIKSLIDLASASDLAELELEENGCRLRLSRDQHPGAQERPASVAIETAADAPEVPSKSPAPLPGPRQADSSVHVVKAPMFGMFSRAPAPNDAPFVQMGDAIQKGQKLGLLEAMKIFTSIEADRDGRIVAILAEDGQEVDAGQALFMLGKQDAPSGQA